MADEVSTGVRAMVERALEADVTERVARRGRELAAAVNDATDTVSARVAEAWRDSEPQRRDAQKSMGHASREAMSWSRKTWARQLRPAFEELWGRRGVAVGATAAAIPAGREIVEDAAVRLGIRKRREERHWMAFFLGILIGAAVGAVVAMLTAPKPGREVRDELAGKAREAADRARDAAGKAREGAGDWVPLFQREESNGEAEGNALTEGDAVTEGDETR